MRRWSRLISFVEDIVDDLCIEIDPDEKRYPDYESMAELRAGLEECLEARAADWQVEQREKHADGMA